METKQLADEMHADLIHHVISCGQCDKAHYQSGMCGVGRILLQRAENMASRYKDEADPCASPISRRR